MKKPLSIVVFWAIVALCSAETIPKFIALAQKNEDLVLFSAGVKPTGNPVKTKKKEISPNYKLLLRDFDAKGA